MAWKDDIVQFDGISAKELEKLVKKYKGARNRHNYAPPVGKLIRLAKKIGSKNIRFGGYLDLRKYSPQKGVFVDTVYVKRPYVIDVLEIADGCPDEYHIRSRWVKLWWD